MSKPGDNFFIITTSVRTCKTNQGATFTWKSHILILLTPQNLRQTEDEKIF